MDHTLTSATILLLLITDPFGNIPVFVATLKGVRPERRVKIILRENLIAFGILLLFMFVGDKFMQLLGLSDVSLQIAGAIVLFLIALKMIFPQPQAEQPLPGGEPLIVPLAIPMIAGPSALATVMLLVSQAPHRRPEWIGALTIAIAVGACILALAERIQRVLGERFVVAMERLMGLILVAVSVEMFVRALRMPRWPWAH